MNDLPATLRGDNSTSCGSTKVRLIHQFLEAEDCGNSRFRSDFIKAHPESEQLLASFMEGLDVLCDFMVENSAPTPPVPESFHQLVLGERFQFDEQIGHGRFGVVWKAWDRQLQRDVALKFPFHGNNEGEVHQLAVREAQAAAGLRHPNIVGVHEVVQASGLAFIVSDHIPSVTLDVWIADESPSLTAKIGVLRKVAEALDYAHQKQVIHRDLKPTNILIDSAGEPHVADFGLAQWNGANPLRGEPGGIVGSPYYMSPEQASGKADAVDGRSDVYALGVLLYWILTEQPPFEGDIGRVLQHHQESVPMDPRLLNSKAPTDLAAISMHCLKKNPIDRYPTAGELASDLRRYLEGKPIRIRPVSVGRKAMLWAHRHPLSAFLSGCLVGTMVVALVVLAMLWRTAEHRLNVVQKERSAHQQTAERLRLSFLHLTRLLLENRIAPKSAPVAVPDVGLSKTSAGTLLGLDGEQISLLPRGIESPLRPTALTQETVPHDNSAVRLQALEEGLAAWCTVLHADEEPHWYRACALHLFAYLTETDQLGLAGWERVQPLLSDLSGTAKQQLQQEYVNLMLEMADRDRASRRFDSACRLFAAADELLEQRGEDPAVLLTAKTGLARMYGRIQLPDEQARVLRSALSIVQQGPSPAVANSNTAVAAAEVLLFDARLRHRDGLVDEALDQLDVATSFASEAVQSGDGNEEARRLLARIMDLQGVIALDHSQPVTAAATFLQAASVLCPSQIAFSPEVSRKRVRYFQLAGNAWRQAEDLQQANDAYMQAIAEMQRFPLDPREARPVWIDAFNNCIELGELYKQRGELDEARQVLRSARDAFDKIPARRRSHATTAGLARQLDEALQSLEAPDLAG